MKQPQTTKEVLDVAETHLESLGGHVFDVLTVTKPISPDAGVNLSKIVSKLSPMLGNLIEFNLVALLNGLDEFEGLGSWERQDPGFPDTVFRSGIAPTPGIEIKAWFPLATEITARFKDSQNHFAQDNTRVAMLAWLPEHLIYGKPKIIDVVVISAKSVAEARDKHYHRPPDYLVIEPEDTTERTRNLQQTNTNGYKWQGTPTEFEAAKRIVERWGKDGAVYKPTQEYQTLLRELMGRYQYRLDTNFAKMDRIEHEELEAFKTRVLNTHVNSMDVKSWARLLNRGTDREIKASLEEHLEIREADPDDLVQ